MKNAVFILIKYTICIEMDFFWSWPVNKRDPIQIVQLLSKVGFVNAKYKIYWLWRDVYVWINTRIRENPRRKQTIRTWRRLLKKDIEKRRWDRVQDEERRQREWKQDEVRKWHEREKNEEKFK